MGAAIGAAEQRSVAAPSGPAAACASAAGAARKSSPENRPPLPARLVEDKARPARTPLSQSRRAWLAAVFAVAALGALRGPSSLPPA